MQPENKDFSINDLRRLEWACRRGMLELDVLLGNFLASHYANLADADKLLFVKLLSQSDPEIFAWLMGQAVSDDVEIQKIVEMIRSHVRK